MKADRTTIRDIAIAVLIAAATAGVYAQVRGFDFLYFDDDIYVFENIHVLKGLTASGVKWAFTSGEYANWHPLTWLSHMTDVQLFGLNASGHHLMSVALHILNSMVLFLLLRYITGAVWKSALVAALFALHPTHVESVAWIAERKDVLSGFFFLLTIAAYAWYCRKPDTVRYVAVAVFFALGLMSKPMLVTLPFVLLLLDIWPLNRLKIVSPTRGRHASQSRSRNTVLVIEKLPFFMLVAISSVVTFILQQKGGAVKRDDYFTFSARIANSIVSYGRYVEKTFLPRNLAALYPHPGDNLPLWQVLTVLVFIIAVTAGAVYSLRKRPWFAVGWFWFLGMLVPVIGIVQVGVQAFADRYLYLPGIGLYIVIIWGADTVRERLKIHRAVTSVAAVVVVAACAGLTWKQTGYWKNSLTQFTHTISVTKDNFLFYNNLGTYLAAIGKDAEARFYLEEALRVRPLYGIAHGNLSVVLRRLGDADGAIVHASEAVRIDPDNADAHTNLATALAWVGDTERALMEYRRAFSLKPENDKTYTELATFLTRNGEHAEARAAFEKALSINPNSTNARNNYGNLMIMAGDIDGAIEQFGMVIDRLPEHAEAWSNLGIALARKGRGEESLVHFRESVALRPDSPDYRNNLANALNNAGLLEEAIAQYEEVLNIEDGNLIARINLAKLYAKTGQLEEARGNAEAALNTAPRSAEAHMTMAVVMMRMGRADDAEEYFAAAVGFNSAMAGRRDELDAASAAAAP